MGLPAKRPGGEIELPPVALLHDRNPKSLKTIRSVEYPSITVFPSDIWGDVIAVPALKIPAHTRDIAA